MAGLVLDRSCSRARGFYGTAFGGSEQGNGKYSEEGQLLLVPWRFLAEANCLSLPIARCGCEPESAVRLCAVVANLREKLARPAPSAMDARPGYCI